MDGLSGRIKFDGAGFRSDFQLDIVELKREGLVKVGAVRGLRVSHKCGFQVGSWDPSNGTNFTRNFTEIKIAIEESLHNKTLVVSTILVSPSIYFHIAL